MYHRVSTMAVDVLAMWGARASAPMLLTQLSLKFWFQHQKGQLISPVWHHIYGLAPDFDNSIALAMVAPLLTHWSYRRLLW